MHVYVYGRVVYGSAASLRLRARRVAQCILVQAASCVRRWADKIEGVTQQDGALQGKAVLTFAALLGVFAISNRGAAPDAHLCRTGAHCASNKHNTYPVNRIAVCEVGIRRRNQTRTPCKGVLCCADNKQTTQSAYRAAWRVRGRHPER